MFIRRGKNNQKHYTVFVAIVDAATKAAYMPNLNTAEHSQWRWFLLQEVLSMPAGKLHPVVRKLLEHHKEAVMQASGS